MTDLLAFVCDVLLLSCHFSNGILGQVWCLIVSIPGLCPPSLSYLDWCFFLDFHMHYDLLFRMNWLRLDFSQILLTI